MKNLKVSIWGFGAMGSGMAKMLHNKQGIDIVAVCDNADHRVSREIHELLELAHDDHKPVYIVATPEEAFPTRSVDVVLLATDSFTRNAYKKIVFCLERGMNVISTAEELAYPYAKEPELARELNEIAHKHHVTVLGTGINPGFVMDYLVLALTGTCESVEKISATRINDLVPFGRTVMEEQGVGVTRDQFQQGLEENTITGHVGFPESIQMIADGIGWPIDKIEETREPIISRTARETAHAKVIPGNVAGCHQRGYGFVDGSIKIEMDHPQQLAPQAEGIETGDTIHIKGIPEIKMTISPEIPGGIGTIAMCVNMIPNVINADPGLKTMLDLPVPRAYMGDWRDTVAAEKRIACD